MTRPHAMQGDLVIRRPEAAAAPATELLLLFHGVGSSAEDLAPLGQASSRDGRAPG